MGLGGCEESRRTGWVIVGHGEVLKCEILFFFFGVLQEMWDDFEDIHSSEGG